ncbi:MAG: peptidoglycan DD-metalloendopeptidase family protein [Rhodobacteraceae bacterium]|nr:peptidoglycan DD-metalloendopeptidase family protein [Paracoccaceae bacterium]
MRAGKRLTSWIAVAMLAPIFAVAQSNPVFEAQMASAALEDAAIALKQAESSKDRVAALTQTIRAYESGLVAMRDGIRSATLRERVLHLEFDQRRDQLSRLLGILQTLERASTPMLLIHPTGPVGTARSGMMMSEISPSLQRQAEELRNQLEELNELKDLQNKAENDLRLGLAGVQEARVSLAQAVSDRTDLPRRFADDPVRTQILADSATSLTIFASSIDALPSETKGTDQKSFSQLKGELALPVSGTILRHFLEADAAGLERPGMLISARPLSLVSAPADSTVRYSGPFLDYGNVIILEPAPGYLVIFAGLDQVYVALGQIVNGGEPIGLLGGKQQGTQEFLIESKEGGGAIAQETLYIELREKGEPINPEAWFSLSDS